MAYEIFKQWIFRDRVGDKPLRLRKISWLGLFTAILVIEIYVATPVEIARQGQDWFAVWLGLVPVVGQSFCLVILWSQPGPAVVVYTTTLVLAGFLVALRCFQVRRTLSQKQQYPINQLEKGVDETP